MAVRHVDRDSFGTKINATILHQTLKELLVLQSLF
jgi:hypothetical protein